MLLLHAVRLAVVVLVFVLFFLSVSSAQAVVDPYQYALQQKYREGGTVKILIVPGHDEVFSGAVYDGVTEAELNLLVAQKLYKELSTNPKLTVVLARNENGFLPLLKKIFDQPQIIREFIQNNRKKTQEAVASGSITVSEQVTHSVATTTVVYQLYGTSLWAAQENFDLILHLHFNDYGSRKWGKPGEYGGYTVYTPEIGLPNASSSKALSMALAQRLGRLIYPTNMPGELKKSDELGVVEDFDLIALGANQTLKVPSALIEYSYIYEPVVSKKLFPFTSGVLARTTAAALDDYIGVTHPRTGFQYRWTTNLQKTKSTTAQKDVLALQFALRQLGFYPAGDATQEDCPITGVFGSCTESSVKEFQKAYKLPATGFFGDLTRTRLNGLFAK